MKIKVMQGTQEMQFDSTEVAIAILLTPKDKEAVLNMPKDDLLILSAPFKMMKERSAEVWGWAMRGWKGAKFVRHHEAAVKTQTQLGR